MQFRNQYTIAKNLAIPGIVRPLSLEPWQNGYALILENFDGISLQRYARDRSLALPETLDVAIQLASILHDLCQHRVVHKDIKPANILIHPESKQIQLIDFSIASLLPKESQEIQNPNRLEGTLAYLAPEQTGRMNRGIDYRADFYGLGVTLYELLAGELPFQSEDPLELVHCHIAEVPVPPHQLEPSIPEMVSAIVLKLMAKNAEDRYQSALGLKHDLEECASQWQETGAIATFELGRRDASDRFLIPEKLYGRKAEVRTLLDAFARVANPPQSPSPSEGGRGGVEIMLVAGFSGVGKTAVVNEVHKPITRQRGYFIKGKFDQFDRNVPFSAFVQAFRSLMGQLLGESDADLADWKAKILEAVGENGRVLVEVIPELEAIVGPQPPVPELSGSAARNRFNLLFGKFVCVFATKAHPLVIFLDDLQWADSASLNLLKLLTNESEAGYLLVLGAYRDNEVFPAHPLMLALEEIQKRGAQLETLTLTPLKKQIRPVWWPIRCSVRRRPRYLYPKWSIRRRRETRFLRPSFCKGCMRMAVLRSIRRAGYWQCDLARARQVGADGRCGGVYGGSVAELPEATQEVLKLAACIGNRFDLATLAVVRAEEREKIAADLWQGLLEGFAIPESETYKFFQGDNCEEEEAEYASVHYRFLHDRVQQAAYALISEDRKQETHLKIGRQLLHNLSESERENRIFAIANHLNAGQDLILDRSERDRIAKLNLQASQAAKASVAYEASRRYCYAGQQFLCEESWKENYFLRFSLVIATIEAEYFNHNLQVAQELSREALEKARTLLDRIKVCELQILFEINQNQMNEAIDLAIQTLALLGITIPKDKDKIQTEVDLLRREIALPAEEIARLVTLEAADDEEKLAAVRILTNATSAAYIANPTVYPAIVLHTVRHCMKYGHSPLAASAYSWYGAILCGVYGEIEAGYEFGKLSVRLLEKFNARALFAKVRNMFDVFVRPWKEHLNNVVTDLPEAIRSGFENGDVEYAFYAAVHYCNYLFYSGCPLDTVRQAQERYLPTIVKAKYEFHAGFLRINQQVVANLLGEADEPQLLQGPLFDGETCLSQWLQNGIVFLVLCFYEAQTRLAYLFEEYAIAVEAGEKGWQYRQAAMGTLYVSEHHFYHSLALLARGALDERESDRVASNQERLKCWAAFSPANFQHKYDLVEAERHRLLGAKIEAIESYDRAIAGAKENNYLQEEALANELAAKFYLDWGKEKVAAGYMQEAYYGYSRWGAKAKADRLEQRYPQLLAPILQPATIAFSSQHSLSSMPSASVTNLSIDRDIWLDFPAIMKAAQAISEEIELEKLLATLMQTAIVNAGAQTGHLFLYRDERWMAVARADRERAEMLEVPLDRAREIPQSLIYSVARTEETAVFENLSAAEQFAGDPYVLEGQPKSVLCTPMSRQGKLVGILYLENHIAVGAFTRDRVEILQLLASQAAISLENARLYQKTENYSQILEAEVEHKTQALDRKARDLETALHELQQTNEELVRATRLKEEFLANMSHEIRTPMNGVLGMLHLLEETEITKQQRSYVRIAQSSADSLLTLINDILNFSKINAGKLELEIIDFDLCDRLGDFAKAIALKAQEKNLELVVDLRGIDRSVVKGDPGRLRQILTNLASNAIKFTERGEVAIRCDLKEESGALVLVGSVSDTGIGIPEDKIDTLFDAFTQVDASITRKYEGTGLGLAITKKLCDLMGGYIRVQSELGKGSCFEFAVVLQPGESLEPIVPPTDLRGLTLLVVDDNATSREVLCGQLESWGAKAIAAEDAPRALALCEVQAQQSEDPNKSPFDLALLDMQMPGMGGAELGKFFKAYDRFKTMPLVAMTSIEDACSVRLAESGFNACLTKPVTPYDLFEVLATVNDDDNTLQNAVAQDASPAIAPPDPRSAREEDDQKPSAREQENRESFAAPVRPEQTRLLLVEDKPISQTVIKALLEKLGLAVDLAADGLEALRALERVPQNHPYALVLMDCQMPEMDGYEAARQIREGKVGKGNRELPIIALTANAMKGDREKCLEAGMNDYLTKPIQPQALNEMMEKWLAKQESKQKA